MSASTLLAAVIAGLALGMRFNPLSAALASGAFAAYVSAGDGRRGRAGVGAAVLAAGWLLGDGLRVIARSREVYDGVRALVAVGAPPQAEWTAIAVWTVSGIALGYALPAWAGAYAGRQTVRGVPAAVGACVAATTALAFAALAGNLAAL